MHASAQSQSSERYSNTPVVKRWWNWASQSNHQRQCDTERPCVIWREQAGTFSRHSHELVSKGGPVVSRRARFPRHCKDAACRRAFPPSPVLWHFSEGRLQIKVTGFTSCGSSYKSRHLFACISCLCYSTHINAIKVLLCFWVLYLDSEQLQLWPFFPQFGVRSCEKGPEGLSTDKNLQQKTHFTTKIIENKTI